MKMRIVIEGDKERNYDGVFRATFKEGDGTRVLKYDLDDWKNMVESGIIGGGYIKLLQPDMFTLEFGQEYEYKKENADKLYDALCLNGWTPTTGD
jgi:hypothetical protein